MKTDRFVSTISNNGTDPEAEDKDKSKKIDWNQTFSTVGSTLAAIFKKPDNITNTTVIQPEEDNTMLYVGIGGAALLVVLLIVFMK